MHCMHIAIVCYNRKTYEVDSYQLEIVLCKNLSTTALFSSEVILFLLLCHIWLIEFVCDWLEYEFYLAWKQHAEKVHIYVRISQWNEAFDGQCFLPAVVEREVNLLACYQQNVLYVLSKCDIILPVLSLCLLLFLCRILFRIKCVSRLHLNILLTYPRAVEQPIY